MSNQLLSSLADKYPLDAAIEKRKALLSAREEKVKALSSYASSLPEISQNHRLIDGGRSWGEFSNDVILSAVQGLDGLAKLPAMVYDKATTGNFYGPETQRISATSDEREKLKSAFAKASAQEKVRVAQEAGKAASPQRRCRTRSVKSSEEERARKEFERAMKEAEKEEAAIQKAMEKVQAQVQKASAEQKAAFESFRESQRIEQALLSNSDEAKRWTETQAEAIETDEVQEEAEMA